jgi:beta-lactamase superfamily II metal-dependent hydrolase
VRQWAARAGLPLTVLSAGQRWTAGGVQFEVVGPARLLRGTESDPNNNSTVLLAQTEGLRVLLTGDIETDAQTALLRAGVPRADVLKVPHHGSADQDPGFLAAVGARVALASIGTDNPYGHPSARTLDVLERAGTRTMRTDLDGSVAIAARNGELDVRPSKRSNHRASAHLGDVPLTRTAAPSDLLSSPTAAMRPVVVPARAADHVVVQMSPRPRARSPPGAAPSTVGAALRAPGRAP